MILFWHNLIVGGYVLAIAGFFVYLVQEERAKGFLISQIFDCLWQ